MLRLTALAVTATTAGAAVAEPPAGLEVDQADLFYDVLGGTSGQILESLRSEAGDVRKDHFAEARWKVNYRYDSRRNAVGSCRVTRVNVWLDLRTIMPRWRAPKATPTSLRQKWQTFDAALKTHERGHNDIVVKVAGEFTEALRTLKGPCDDLEGRAQQLLTEYIARGDALNSRYDDETRHGRDQGAWWDAARDR